MAEAECLQPTPATLPLLKRVKEKVRE